MAKDKATKIGTLTKSRGRARGNDFEGCCAVAFHAAKRDAKAYFVGATYFGFKIVADREMFPRGQTIARVEPSGEVFKIEPDLSAAA